VYTVDIEAAGEVTDKARQPDGQFGIQPANEQRPPAVRPPSSQIKPPKQAK
jgi:hypothetical protein